MAQKQELQRLKSYPCSKDLKLDAFECARDHQVDLVKSICTTDEVVGPLFQALQGDLVDPR